MAETERFGGWSGVDALVLSAFSGSRRGSSLADLMATSDAWDKNYPSRDELASALGALVAAGLIEPSERGFRKTRAGRAIVRKAGFFGRYRDVLPHLADIPRATTEWPIASSAVSEAIDAYLGRHRR